MLRSLFLACNQAEYQQAVVGRHGVVCAQIESG
jgi:hypothetical protein